MLKALIKKQIAEALALTFRGIGRNRAGSGGKKRRLSGNGTVVVMALVMLYLSAMFTFFSVTLCNAMLGVQMLWLYYLLTGGAAIVFGTFGSIFSTYFTLYMAKDNDLLLSMPIKIRVVIISRLFGVYFMGLLYSGLVSIPAVIVSLVLAGFSLPRFFGGLILILLSSLIVLGLSCLLGWVVAKLSQKLKNRSFLTVLIALGIVGLYYYIYFRIMDRVQDLLTIVVRVGERIRGSAYPIYLFGRIGEGDWLAMLGWTAAVLVLLGLIWLVLQKTFLSISTATPAPKKAVYREKTHRQRSASAALFRKEYLRFSSSANYMLNCGVPLLLMLGCGGYLLLNGDRILGIISMTFWNVKGSVPVLACALCCTMGGMVDISAPSVSLEGHSLWQLQCLPVKPWQVLRSKLLFHLALTSVPTLFCSVVLTVLVQGTVVQKLLILVVSVLYAILFAMFGLFLGLKMPNLDWTNEIVPIKQSAAVLISMFSGIGLGMAFGLLYLLVGRSIGATAWMGIFAFLVLDLDAAFYFWLRGPGARRFAAL